MLLDCPPSLGVLTVAALTAADGVLIPLQCETLSHRGVGQLLDTVHDVRRFTNRDLEVWGVLPTLYDGRTNHARTVLETISETYDLEVIEPPIPKTIKFAEAPGRGPLDPGDLAQQQGREGLPRGRGPPGRAVAAAPARGARTRQEVSRHRATIVRPRYARMGAAVASLCVTLVAVLGGFGVLPVSSGLANASGDPPAEPARRRPAGADRRGPGGGRPRRRKTGKKSKGNGAGASADATESKVDPQLDATLPEGSGTGKRVVFSESRQRVWLVDEDEQVERTYLVSGSVYDNLEPGAFNVYSRSEDAWGVDDSGSMKYFVRFTQGDTGAAIGFHDIPVKDGAAGPDRVAARHADQPRLHPPAALRRDRALGVRPARYVGDRHRLRRTSGFAFRSRAGARAAHDSTSSSRRVASSRAESRAITTYREKPRAAQRCSGSSATTGCDQPGVGEPDLQHLGAARSSNRSRANCLLPTTTAGEPSWASPRAAPGRVRPTRSASAQVATASA